MKSMRNLSTLLLSCGIAFAMVSTLAAQTVQGSATVVRIKGSARYSEGGSWKNLKVGDVLRPGTLVQTGLDRGSYVDLVLSESGSSAAAAPTTLTGGRSGATSNKQPLQSYVLQAEQNVVRLNENTALGIDKLTAMNTGADTVTETQLDLKQGRITGNVKKLSPASKYEIKLPNGVAGIRGTLFDITADGVVKVAVGSVVVAYYNANKELVTKIVNANEQFDARTGEVTPLGIGAFNELSSVGTDLILRGGMAETQFIIDRTLYNVSPTR